MTTSVTVCWTGTEPLEEAEAALTLGRRIAAETTAELRWLLLGTPPDAYADVARRHGVAAVDMVDDAAVAAGDADLVVAAIAGHWADHPGGALVFAQTFDTRAVAPRVAARIGAAVVTNVVDVDTGGAGLEVSAAAYGGDTRVLYEVAPEVACVVALQPNAIEPEAAPGTPPEPVVEKLGLDLAGVVRGVRLVKAASSEGPRLEDADVIVAGGRGLKSAENYQLVVELAEVLGGMAGASRPIVDDGWIDSAHQVGLTGKITRPALYIAAGISGATQHVVGCTAAKTIVAINTDPDASIFRHARYGIVGDCLEVLPELIRASRDTGAHR